MKIIESAENAFGASVRYEHDGEMFTVRGTSITEIKRRILDELAEEDQCRNVPEPESSGGEDVPDQEPDPSGEEKENG
ncbi:MAG: hypothetical protein J6S40_02170 [Thermoguttaceae bacterium]|nr:hypothetical protein [Thermoguttaceae bacterium]